MKAFGLTDNDIKNIEQLHKDLSTHYNISLEEAHDYLIGKGMPEHASKQLAEEFERQGGKV